jgi:hypothetical protein
VARVAATQGPSKHLWLLLWSNSSGGHCVSCQSHVEVLFCDWAQVPTGQQFANIYGLLCPPWAFYTWGLLFCGRMIEVCNELCSTHFPRTPMSTRTTVPKASCYSTAAFRRQDSATRETTSIVHVWCLGNRTTVWEKREVEFVVG